MRLHVCGDLVLLRTELRRTHRLNLRPGSMKLSLGDRVRDRKTPWRDRPARAHRDRNGPGGRLVVLRRSSHGARRRGRLRRRRRFRSRRLRRRRGRRSSSGVASARPRRARAVALLAGRSRGVAGLSASRRALRSGSRGVALAVTVGSGFGVGRTLESETPRRRDRRRGAATVVALPAAASLPERCCHGRRNVRAHRREAVLPK